MTEGNATQEQRALQQLLRELRVGAGLRQIDVAKSLGLPQSMVSKYEIGERRLDVIEVRQLCALFGISLVSFVEKLELRLRNSN